MNVSASFSADPYTMLSATSFDTLNGELLDKAITVFGYILSSMAIAIHIFIHLSTDLFQNLPGHLLASNCILLFLQYCFSTVYLTLDSKHSTWNREVKQILHTSDYYFTAYIWSLLTRVQFVMALDLWRCLRTQTTNLKFASGQEKRFFKYILITWVSPFIELALLWSVKRLMVRPNSDCIICTMETWEPVLFYYFITDMILMLSNFLLYIWCICFIYKTRSSVKSSTRESGFVYYFKICGRLFIMSEVNYTLLILVYHFNIAGLKQLFTNFMAYHGLMVFAFIVLQKTLLKKKKSIRTESENMTSVANVTTNVSSYRRD